MESLINKNRLVSLFSLLVETDSKTLFEREICDVIKKEFIDLGYDPIEDNAGENIGGNAGNLYVYIDGDIDKEPILFSAHMDTVEPSKNKKCIVDPNGKIHSDGTTVLGADDISGVCAIIESIKVLKENNISHRPIEILISISEENYCKGISQFDFTKVKSKEAYVLDLSGKVGVASYAAPTIISFKAEIIGKASHAGFAPDKGIHSIKILSKAISTINIGKIDDETTVNIGTISGGIASNIVPEHCNITGEIRSYNDSKAMEQYSIIENIISKTAKEFKANANISFEKHVTAYETDVNDNVVKRFQNVCHNIGIETKLIRTFGGSDNNVMSLEGIKGLVIANAMNDVHTLGEWTTIDELTKACELTLNLMI